MRQRTLGQKRAILLAIPFAGAVACGSVGGVDGGIMDAGIDAGCPVFEGCGPAPYCPLETQVAPIPPSDGGIGDGGCQAVCLELQFPGGLRFIDIQSCTFTTLDGGAAVSCTGHYPCG
jgi:hypothetical protein